LINQNGPEVVIINYPENKTEDMETINNPEDESMGSRTIPFSREIYIEQEDFMEDPPKNFFRLGPGSEERLYDRMFSDPDPADFQAEMEEYMAAASARYSLINQIEVLNENMYINT
jgi:glutamyl/glutaminyl-tRNA synthetase